MNKKPFLVVYDYSTGGVWALIYAADKAQIGKKYPILKVVDNRPTWMTDELFKKIQINLTFDIDDEPRGWLLTIVDEQKKRQVRRSSND